MKQLVSIILSFVFSFSTVSLNAQQPAKERPYLTGGIVSLIAGTGLIVVGIANWKGDDDIKSATVDIYTGSVSAEKESNGGNIAMIGAGGGIAVLGAILTSYTRKPANLSFNVSRNKVLVGYKLRW